MKFTLSLIIILLLTNLAFTQEVKIEKSSKIITLNNKKYYIHIVKEKETLYGISKAYNIDQKEIAIENPEVLKGLQVGQELKIPVLTEKSDIKQSPLATTQFIYHTVVKGQTLYAISKQYNHSIDELIKYNPELQNGLKTGSTLKIPTNQTMVSQNNVSSPPTSQQPLKTTTNIEQIQNDTQHYHYHTIKKSETLYSICKQYNCDEKTILQHNPHIASEFKAGEIIKIPKQSNIPKSAAIIADALKKDTLLTQVKQQDPVLQETNTPCNQLSNEQYNVPINVALLLPFYLSENSINTQTVEEKKEINPKSKIFIEFYEGMLLALDSLKKQGMLINLYVFDTNDDTNNVKKILQKPELKKIDVIIGPAYQSELKIVSSFAKENKKIFISPLSSNTVAENNQLCFQVNPPIEVQIESLSKHVTRYADKNIIMLNNGSDEEQKIIETIKTGLLNYVDANKISTLTFTEIFYKAEGIDGIKSKLINDITKQNIIIIPSTEQVFISSIISKLYMISDKYNITVIGRPDWRRFENINYEYLHKLNYQTYSTANVDYTNSFVKHVINQYRNSFGNEPSKYSFQGYDVTLYFLTAIKKYGLHFAHCLSQHQPQLTQSSYQFKKLKNNDGYINTTTYIINYTNNFEITTIE